MAATDNLAAKVAAGQPAPPDLVIWPENSTDIDPMQYPPVYEEIASAAAAISRPILVGAVLQNPVRNAGVLWLPGKGPMTMYVKQKLVPFGEYIPLRCLISKITSLTALQPENFTPGNKTVVFHVGQIRLGEMICWEVGFDDHALGGRRRRQPADHAEQRRHLRARGRDDRRERPAARHGPDSRGRARPVGGCREHHWVQRHHRAGRPPDLRSGIWQQAELEASVPLLTYTTLADRVGAWPEYVIVAATAAALVPGRLAARPPPHISYSGHNGRQPLINW